MLLSLLAETFLLADRNSNGQSLSNIRDLVILLFVFLFFLMKRDHIYFFLPLFYRNSDTPTPCLTLLLVLEKSRVIAKNRVKWNQLIKTEENLH